MIFDMPNTTTAKVSRSLVSIREEGGAVALGRVLTLVIATAPGEEEDAIRAANEASREHPMRVIVVSIPRESSNITNRLDAEIRVGGDAGASEVIVLRAYGAVGQDESSLVIGLLLPDAPVVTWWPGLAPTNVSHSSLGQIAQCRITDARGFSDPLSQLDSLSATYAPGDADFAWTRVTLWRAQLAAILDQPPHEPITAVTVVASANSPSATLLAAWLSLQLSLDVTLTLKHDDRSDGSIRAVTLSRFSGDVTFKRVNDNVVRLTQAGQPTHDVTLPNRSLRDCLSEELRRLDPDVVYGEVITQGLMLVRKAIA